MNIIASELVAEKAGTRASIGKQQPDFMPALLDAVQFYGRRGSIASLGRNLPLDEDRLPREHLAEAASHARLSVKPLAGLALLGKASLPVIVELADGRVLTLLKRETAGYVAGSGGRPEPEGFLSFEDLKRNAPRAAWYIRPDFFFDHRSLHFDLPERRHWLISPLMANASTYAYAALAGLVVNVIAIATSLYSMAVYDRVLPNNSLNSLIGLTSGVLIIIAADLVLKITRGYLVDVAGRRFDVEAGSRVFSQMLSVRPEARPASSGALAQLVREFDSVRDFFTSATLLVLADLPFVFFYLAIIAFVGGYLFFVTLTAITLLILAGVVIQWPMKRSLAKGFRESNQKAAFLHEVVSGLDTLRASNAEAWARRQWEHFIAQSSATSMETRGLSLGFGILTASMSQIAWVATVALGAVLASHSEMTSGGIIAAVILSSRCIAPFTQVAGLMARWQQVRLAFGALNRFMQAPTDVAAGQHALQNFEVKGAIEFSAVRFTYPAEGMAAAGNMAALTDLSVRIGEGEAVGVIGRVGSGKSTLLKLLVRLMDAQEGHIRLDGVDIRQIHPAELRRQLGYAGQDTALFHGTIQENLLIGKPSASDAEILDAAKASALLDVIGNSALGLATPVGERGGNLSGGQRQAVGLARALLMNPPVLLLDEPTSMMDSTTEQRFLAELAERRRNRTTLIVTHKLQLLRLTPRVLVLDGGRIVADGPRDEVIARLTAKPSAEALS